MAVLDDAIAALSAVFESTIRRIAEQVSSVTAASAVAGAVPPAVSAALTAELPARVEQQVTTAVQPAVAAALATPESRATIDAMVAAAFQQLAAEMTRTGQLPPAPPTV